MNPMVKLESVKTYFYVRRGLFSTLTVRAVDGVSLDIGEGEIVGVIGESGCGKTTLGRTAVRLVKPVSGRIIFEGKDVTNIKGNEKWFRRRAQMIFQDPFTSLNPYMTIAQILEEPLIIHGFQDPKVREELIVRALEEMKLTPPEEFLPKYPHMLSGGQRQRVGIARALVLEPRFLVADEPVSMIDASSRAEVLYLFRELQKKHGISIMYITHDIATAKYFTDRIAVMYTGKIVERGPTYSIVKNPKHPYTEALVAAIPDPDPKNRFVERKVIPGEPPSPINPPSGCRFHPRCPYAMPVCREKEPPFTEVELDRFVACWLYSRR